MIESKRIYYIILLFHLSVLAFIDLQQLKLCRLENQNNKSAVGLGKDKATTEQRLPSEKYLHDSSTFTLSSVALTLSLSSVNIFEA